MTRVRPWLIAILVATFLARVGFLLFFANTLSLETSGYDAYAVHLLDGHGYTRFDDRAGDSDLPPLYPFLLAGVYRLFGRDPVPVACVQIVFELLTTFLLYRIGRRLGGETTGLLSAAFYGFYPYLLFQNLTVNDTGIFICLLAIAVWLSYRVPDSQRPRHAVALGLVIGAAALTKTLVILVLPLLIMSWCRTLGLRRTIRLALLTGVSAAAVLSPWVIRNTLLHGELVFISTNGGSNLHQGNNPCVADYLVRGWDAQWVRCLAVPPPGLSEVEEDHWHRNEAIRYLKENPRSWPRLFATKFSVLWNPAIMPADLPPDVKADGGAVLLYGNPAFRAARVLHLVYFGPLLVFGLIGLVWGWRDRVPIEPLVAVPLVITVFYVVFHPSTRYRSPADPFLFILAAYALSKLGRRLIVPKLAVCAKAGPEPFNAESVEHIHAGGVQKLSKMNVLHVVPYYEPAWSYGGVVRAVTGLARQQVSSGYRVAVLTTDTASASRRLPAGCVTVDGVTVERVRNLSNFVRAELNLSTPVGFGRTARQLIEQHGIELVHCHELRTLENLRVGPIADRLDMPLVLSPHGTLPYGIGRGLIKKSWDQLFGRKLLHRFDHVLALSEQEACEVRALWSRYRIPLGDDQLTVLPNGIHQGDFERLPDREESRRRWTLGPGPVVIFLGRLSKRKGLDLLIPAFAAAISQIPSARLLLAGPDEGMEGQLRDLTIRCNIAPHVVFTGMLSGDARLAALRAADVFILPAEGEGSSMSTLEAMACELPLILTPGCNFPEVAAADAGLVVPREIASLTDALRALLIDSERRLSMARRARELVLERYAWPRLVARMDSVYQAALARHHSKSQVSHAAD